MNGVMRIGMNVKVVVEKREDHYAAIVQPLGIRVYASTEAQALVRADYALTFLCEASADFGLPSLQAYLDKHGVEYTIDPVRGDSDSAAHNSETSVSRQVEVTLAV